jgi:glycosyltransferase involved in cell wall biosynthesis
MRSRIILGHPFGNANVRQALLALSSENLLESFVTTLCAERVPLVSVFPESIRAEIQRRSFSMVPQNKIISYAGEEALRLLGARLGRFVPAIRRFSPTVDDVWHSLDRHLAKEARRSDAEDLTVYAYEDGALAAFSSLPRARKFYELPIGYWKSMHSLLHEECLLKPEWSSTLVGLSDSSEKLARKDAELDLSDQIIVPSDFVKSTLPPSWAPKATVVRYGCPTPIQAPTKSSPRRGPLRVLFCGSLGQRKGISYLFEAAQRMGQYMDLTVVGREGAPCPALEKALAGVTWHRSLPHSKILELMRGQDVFLFPTLFEGRALVVLEALSQGLPVITTIHSGAADVIENGRSGFLVPIRSVDAIVQALESLYEDPGLLAHMKEQALAIASETSWASYRKNLIRACTQYSSSGQSERVSSVGRS